MSNPFKLPCSESRHPTSKPVALVDNSAMRRYEYLYLCIRKESTFPRVSTSLSTLVLRLAKADLDLSYLAIYCGRGRPASSDSSRVKSALPKCRTGALLSYVTLFAPKSFGHMHTSGLSGG